MSRVLRRQMFVFFAGLPIAMLSGPAATTQTPALSADQIIQKTVQRAASLEVRNARPNYHYTKHTVTEELDLKGHLKDRKEKLYDVLVESGLSYLKLLEFNGQALSPAESKKQEERELAERQKFTDAKPDKKGDDRENFVTPDLIEKYNFTLVEQKVFNGRTTYLLSFEPKDKLPVRKLTDRFLNEVAGTVWIDSQEFEVARVEAHLKGEVALWGGMIGTLKECAYTLERTRLADGAWFNSFSHGVFEGRKLLEPMVIRTRSNSSNFRRVTLALR